MQHRAFGYITGVRFDTARRAKGRASTAYIMASVSDLFAEILTRILVRQAKIVYIRDKCGISIS